MYPGQLYFCWMVSAHALEPGSLWFEAHLVPLLLATPGFTHISLRSQKKKMKICLLSPQPSPQSCNSWWHLPFSWLQWQYPAFYIPSLLKPTSISQLLVWHQNKSQTWLWWIELTSSWSITGQHNFCISIDNHTPSAHYLSTTTTSLPLPHPCRHWSVLP